MDDSGAPGVSTPEHWSDVGPLSGRLQLVEQQVQAVQAHIAHLSSQMAVVGQSMQQVEMQLMMQQKQHEDLMKLLVNCMAPQDSAGVTRDARKARPGPRERQRMRREAEANSLNQVIVQPPEVLRHVPPVPLEPPAQLPAPSPAPSPVLLPVPPAPAPDASVPPSPVPPPAAAAVLAKPSASESKGRLAMLWSSHRRMSWYVVILMWLLYLAMRDLTPSPTPWEIEEDFDVGSVSQPWEARRDARRLRELGHLQLSVSDCQGAAQLFGRALELANSTVNLEDTEALRQELDFALVCARRFEEAIGVLGQFAPAELPVHLLNALGFAHFHRSEVVEAADCWQEALQLAPQNPVLWNNLGAARALLGDVRASEALLMALSTAEQLSTAAGRYYLQLVSNNIHTHRRYAAPELPSRHELHVEIFHCIASDISVLVSGTPGAELVQQYKRVEMHAAAEGVDVNLVEETRKAVLGSEREYLLCP